MSLVFKEKSIFCIRGIFDDKLSFVLFKMRDFIISYVLKELPRKHQWKGVLILLMLVEHSVFLCNLVRSF